MALETHPKGTEGVYEDNLPGVAGVKVDIKKTKRYEVEGGSGGEGRDKKKTKAKRFLFCFFKRKKKKIRGPTRFEVRTATVPRQWHQKACWVFKRCE